MENADSDGTEEKRTPQKLSENNSSSHPMARNSSTSPSSNEPIDAGVLQYQNQNLVQRLDMWKREMHDLETRTRELLEREKTLDSILMSTNRIWNQLVDDFILFGVEAGGDPNCVTTLDQMDNLQGSNLSCPPEENSFRRLLQVDPETEKNYKILEEALNTRYSSSRELMSFLQETIDTQNKKCLSLGQALHESPSSKDILCKIEEMFTEEANHLRQVVDAIHVKHKEYADEIQSLILVHSVDQAEIKRLADDLEENISELEESRRNFTQLKIQKDVAAGVSISVPSTLNGSMSPEKSEDKSKGLTELKDSIEEAKVLAADRLSELQEVQEDNIGLLKQVQDIENELKDEKHVHTSRPYTVLKDQLFHWNAEVGRYKGLTDSLQADRLNVVQRDAELKAKAAAADAARSSVELDSNVEDLKLQLKNCIVENNEAELKMEEAVQDSGRKDVKAEFSVMASALSREMRMMQAQLNRWQETAEEAISLREKSMSLHTLLISKATEQKKIAEQCAKQMAEIKSLQELIETMHKEKLELQLVLDMYGQENCENSRDLKEIEESKSKALSQANALQNALDEHSLLLRVKAANEAELACQHRLSAAEAEKIDLWEKLDASDRELRVLNEAIKIKDAEAEAYISEIETIGQAYEDMQTQNQHLLQQIAERDEYNIKLVSESVKTKQSYNNLLSQKQALTKQLSQVNTALDSVKMRIARSEEQMKILWVEAKKSSQEERHLAMNLEMAKWELADAEKELKWLKSVVATSEKEYEQIQKKTHDAQARLDNERNERKRLEAELVETNQKVAELTAATGEAAIQKLKDEIKECKSILKCGVCSDRPKEVVITKCYHLFCHTCIQKNLETRHRKCPGCGTAFGQNDVRFVKI